MAAAQGVIGLEFDYTGAHPDQIMHDIELAQVLASARTFYGTIEAALSYIMQMLDVCKSTAQRKLQRAVDLGMITFMMNGNHDRHMGRRWMPKNLGSIIRKLYALFVETPVDTTAQDRVLASSGDVSATHLPEINLEFDDNCVEDDPPNVPASWLLPTTTRTTPWAIVDPGNQCHYPNPFSFHAIGCGDNGKPCSYRGGQWHT